MPGSNRIMKHTVLSSGLHDADIRPPALLNEFKQLSLRDGAKYFGGAEGHETTSCPGCGEGAHEAAFDKDGYRYVRCNHCASLYVNPRPTAAMVSRYYEESEASRFHALRYTEGTASQRRYHLLRSQATWMGQLIGESGLGADPSYGDFQTHSPARFDEVADLACFGHLYSVDAPIPVDSHCETSVIETTLDDAPSLDVISAFEKLEHQHAPERFLSRLHEHLSPGGLLFLTTRTCSGFDIQILGEKAPYLFVPEHLNLMSINGLTELIQRSGLELVELSTPGQLDVELVKQTCAGDPSVELPPFVETLVGDRDRLAHGDFQAFLQKHRLSSHVRIAARKPG